MRSRSTRLLALLVAVPLLMGAAAAQTVTPTSEPMPPEDRHPHGPLPVEGVITDGETGKPLAYARVTAWVEGEDEAWKDSTETDEDGRFVLHLGPGNGMIEVWREKYKAYASELRVGEDGTEDLSIALKPEPKPAGHVTGLVVDAAGKPIEGATVSLNTVYRHYEETAVEYDEGGGGASGSAGTATSADGGTDDADAATSDADEPRATKLIAPAPYPYDWQQTTTDAAGRYEFWTHPGPIQLRAEAKGYAISTAELDVKDGDNAAPRLALEKVPDANAIVKGRVIDADTGLPVKGAWVSVENQEWGRHQSARTDATGAYSVKTLPGRVRVQVNYWGEPEPVAEPALGGIATDALSIRAPARTYYTWVTALDAKPGDNPVDADLTPKPLPTIPLTGWVIDEKTQKGIAGAWVNVRNEDTGEYGHVQTDKDGSFRLLVREGHHVLDAGAQGYFLGTRLLTVDGPLPKPLALPLKAGETKWAPCYDCYETYATDGDAGGAAEPMPMPAPRTAGSSGAVADKSALSTGAPASAGDDRAEGAGNDGGQGSGTYTGGAGGLGPYPGETASYQGPDDAAPQDPTSNVPFGGLAVALAGLGVAALALRRRG